MDTPNNFRGTPRVPKSAPTKRESTPPTDYIMPERELYFVHVAWQSFAVRGVYTVVQIVIKTCIEQVSAAISMSAKDLKFYQKCENDARNFASELEEMMVTRLEPRDFGPTFRAVCNIFKPWTQSFIDKMQSLNTKSSLMAVARIMYASKYFRKTPMEFHEQTWEPYVDPDPTSTPVNFDDLITSMLEVLRGQISWYKRWRQQNLPADGAPAARQSSPPASTRARSPTISTRARSPPRFQVYQRSPPLVPLRRSSPPPALTRARSPARMVSSGRSFADVLVGRQSPNLGARSAWPPLRNF